MAEVKTLKTTWADNSESFIVLLFFFSTYIYLIMYYLGFEK